MAFRPCAAARHLVLHLPPHHVPGRSPPRQAPDYPLDRYALYISFFPQAIAGPLARWSEVMHQFGREVLRRDGSGNSRSASPSSSLGSSKHHLARATRSAACSIRSTRRPRRARSPTAISWLALGFGFQVLFDFAGYSDIAIGLGPPVRRATALQFNAPLRSTNLQDFWQRWHMTLMLFLRDDAVFVPLSNVKIGQRRRRLAPASRRRRCSTMALCGLWHARARPRPCGVGDAARRRAGGRLFAVAPAPSAAAVCCWAGR